jgi:hypothetical protein
MSENLSGDTKARFILTKAYEISYALFRIASQIIEKDFSEQLRVSGTALLAQTATGDYMAAGKSLDVMECLIKFAGDVNIIGTGNSDVLLREIYALNAAIDEAKKMPIADHIDIAGIFSKPEIAFKKDATVRQSAKEKEPAIIYNPAMEAIRQNNEIHENQEQDIDGEAPANNNINAILKSAIRQTAILERIRQSGNCRLKDIQEILPGTSERTIRYDIQTLLEQELIERVGIAGPSVYYRAKQMV